MQFSLVQIIGLILLGGSCLLLGVGFPELIRRMDYSRDLWRDGLLLICILGIACFVTGIATLLKRKWTRPVITVALLTIGLYFAYIFLSDMPNSGRKEYYYVLVIGLVVFTLLLCGILYINNDKVIADYEAEEGRSLLEEDILDL